MLYRVLLSCLLLMPLTLSAYATGHSPRQTVFVRSEQNQNVSGGACTNPTWATHKLNVEDNPAGYTWFLGVDNATNRFTLAAGIYEIEASAPGFYIDQHRGKLYNVTDGRNEILGSSENAGGGLAITSVSRVIGRIALASQKTFELQTYCTTSRSPDALGTPTNIAGLKEVFATVKITKIY